MFDGKQPERSASDGPVSVTRPAANKIAICATTDGQGGELVMSEYNAWRVFAMLAVILGIPLPAKARKIKL